MANVTKVTPTKRRKFLAMLEEDGNVSRAARQLNVSRRHLYRIRDEDEEFKAAWEEAAAEGRENLINEAEESMRALIGERNVAATIFTLKTLGKERGWVEKVETEQSGELTIRVRYEDA